MQTKKKNRETQNKSKLKRNQRTEEEEEEEEEEGAAKAPKEVKERCPSSSLSIYRFSTQAGFYTPNPTHECVSWPPATVNSSLSMDLIRE